MAKSRTALNKAAVDSALVRRSARAGQQDVEVKWFIKEVSTKISLTMQQRVRLATEFLKSKVVRNISRPVTKTVIGGGQSEGGKSLGSSTQVTGRSKYGEFPKADTTQLIKSIFAETIQSSSGAWDGFVGTNLDYGLILEVSKRLNRSYLVRSLRENRSEIKRILSGPLA